MTSIKIRDKLYDTFVRFKLAAGYYVFWDPYANGGVGEEKRAYK
jgi:hypothetical protein